MADYNLNVGPTPDCCSRKSNVATDISANRFVNTNYCYFYQLFTTRLKSGKFSGWCSWFFHGLVLVLKSFFKPESNDHTTIGRVRLSTQLGGRRCQSFGRWRFSSVRLRRASCSRAFRSWRQNSDLRGWPDRSESERVTASILYHQNSRRRECAWPSASKRPKGLQKNLRSLDI